MSESVKPTPTGAPRFCELTQRDIAAEWMRRQPITSPVKQFSVLRGQLDELLRATQENNELLRSLLARLQ